MFDVNIKHFNKAAAIVGSVIFRHEHSIPVLSTMKVRANGRLVLTGTDLDNLFSVSIPCETKTEAEFLIDDHKAVISAIGAAGGERATFAAVAPARNDNPTDRRSTDPAGFSVRAGKLNRVARHGQKVDDWPVDACSIGDEAFAATLGADTIRQIERVMAAISKEETRYYLNGVHLHHVDGWTYRAVATDGHRLMMVNLELPDATGALPASVIIPRVFLTQAMKQLRQAAGPVRFRAGSARKTNQPDATLAPTPVNVSRVALSGTIDPNGIDAQFTFAGKTIDGTFPDYSRVVPKENKHRALFSVPELRQAVQAVSAGMKDARAIKLSFGPDGVDVGMAWAGEGFTASYRIEAGHDFPDGFAIGINGNYLLDMLAAVGGAEVVFLADDSAAPTKWLSTSDTAFVGVLMPMRV